MEQAGKYDIIIEQGKTYRQSFVYKDSAGTLINLTGFDARMQGRDSSGTKIIELLTTNGGLTITAAAGKIDLYLSATATAAFTFDTLDYDIELVQGADVYPFLTGMITLTPEYTR